MTEVSVRPATADDVPVILSLIRELAVYEREPDAVKATEADLRRHLFGEGVRAAECLIGSLDGQVQGFAISFTTFSTWLGKPGLWLEDLFVRPAARGRGLGRALLRELAAIAVARGYGRLEWSVLDWNEPAIGFYRALGARAMNEWTTYRVAGDGLRRLAESPTHGNTTQRS